MHGRSHGGDDERGGHACGQEQGHPAEAPPRSAPRRLRRLVCAEQSGFSRARRRRAAAEVPVRLLVAEVLERTSAMRAALDEVAVQPMLLRHAPTAESTWAAEGRAVVRPEPSAGAAAAEVGQRGPARAEAKASQPRRRLLRARAARGRAARRGRGRQQTIIRMHVGVHFPAPCSARKRRCGPGVVWPDVRR